MRSTIALTGRGFDLLGRYFDSRGLSADWDTLKDAEDELLINSRR